MTTTYELKRFKSSRSPDLAGALKLYSQNIEPSYRTNTNEILYWIDNHHKEANFSFYILGLYMNGLLIGFAEMAYFQEEKFIEVDYLVIDKSFRKNNSFYEFLDKIGDFITEENIIFDYIICEVGCYFEGLEPSENSKTLMRLLKMAHFGIIKCAYYVPMLGKNNYESQMRAVLVIYSAEELIQLKKETYLMITHTLFYKYYQKWFSVFFTAEENKEYKKNLDELFEEIKKDVENRKFIEINGYQNLLPLKPTDFSAIKARKGIKLLSFIVILGISTFLFGMLAIYIQRRFKIDIANQASLISLAVVVASVATSLLFNRGSNILARVIEKIVDKI